VLFRGEHLSWRLAIGAAIVVAAVALVVRQEPADAPAPEETGGSVPAWSSSSDA
jgi:drug/metabolite transporter (DMT)-like permease